MQQVISPRGVITWSVLHECVIMCAVLHEEGVGVGAGVQYGFFKMADGNFAWNRVISFSQLFCLFWKKKFFRNSRFPVRSVFVINVSLFTFVVCYCQNGLRGKHGKCSLCNEWWHSLKVYSSSDWFFFIAWNPFIFLLFRILSAMISTDSTHRRADKGHPWRIPLVFLNISDIHPLLMTQVWISVYIYLLILNNKKKLWILKIQENSPLFCRKWTFLKNSIKMIKTTYYIKRRSYQMQ